MDDELIEEEKITINLGPSTNNISKSTGAKKSWNLPKNGFDEDEIVDEKPIKVTINKGNSKKAYKPNNVYIPKPPTNDDDDEIVEEKISIKIGSGAATPVVPPVQKNMQGAGKKNKKKKNKKATLDDDELVDDPQFTPTISVQSGQAQQNQSRVQTPAIDPILTSAKLTKITEKRRNLTIRLKNATAEHNASQMKMCKKELEDLDRSEQLEIARLKEVAKSSPSQAQQSNIVKTQKFLYQLSSNSGTFQEERPFSTPVGIPASQYFPPDPKSNNMQQKQKQPQKQPQMSYSEKKYTNQQFLGSQSKSNDKLKQYDKPKSYERHTMTPTERYGHYDKYNHNQNDRRFSNKNEQQNKQYQKPTREDIKLTLSDYFKNEIGELNTPSITIDRHDDELPNYYKREFQQRSTFKKNQSDDDEEIPYSVLMDQLPPEERYRLDGYGKESRGAKIEISAKHIVQNKANVIIPPSRNDEEKKSHSLQDLISQANVPTLSKQGVGIPSLAASLGITTKPSDSKQTTVVSTGSLIISTNSPTILSKPQSPLDPTGQIGFVKEVTLEDELSSLRPVLAPKEEEKVSVLQKPLDVDNQKPSSIVITKGQSPAVTIERTVKREPVVIGKTGGLVIEKKVKEEEVEEAKEEVKPEPHKEEEEKKEEEIKDIQGDTFEEKEAMAEALAERFFKEEPSLLDPPVYHAENKGPSFFGDDDEGGLDEATIAENERRLRLLMGGEEEDDEFTPITVTPKDDHSDSEKDEDEKDDHPEDDQKDDYLPPKYEEEIVEPPVEEADSDLTIPELPAEVPQTNEKPQMNEITVEEEKPVESTLEDTVEIAKQPDVSPIANPEPVSVSVSKLEDEDDVEVITRITPKAVEKKEGGGIPSPVILFIVFIVLVIIYKFFT